ncbi:MAG: hypothetical protein M3Y80_06845 [Verrucomicrobiota bacterium]|nr:hypothetical protein [Verrucomicrobiota bacterium]
MRTWIILALLACGIAAAGAQEQERKLMDRVLKPDMSLQNEMQAKQFGVRGNAEAKQVHTKSFYVADRRQEKQYAGARVVTPKAFAAPQSSFQDAQANLSTRTRIARADTPFAAGGYGGVKTSWDSGKSVETGSFAGSDRPFLVRGKSQKAISQKNKQLTIDDVRELLNKNK